MATPTIPNPFYVDLNDPKLKRQVEKLFVLLKTRRPSVDETKKKLVTLNAKIDKNRIHFDKLMKEIPELMVEIMMWQKYQQHKEQQDQQTLAVVEEETRLRMAELELEKKKAALKTKRVVRRNPMLEDTAPILDDFKPISNKIQIIVKDVVGKSHFVEVVASSTIDELHNYVFSGFTDVPKEDCALSTGSKTLELGKTFAEQGVEELHTIHMFIRQRGGGKKKKYRGLAIKRTEYITQRSFAANLLFAHEQELDAIFEKFGGAASDGDDSISLGSESERSGASEEYKRGKDPDYVPKDDEGDEDDEGDFDDCAHEWLNSAGLCFDCGAEVGAHPTAPSFPTTPFQPKEE